MQLINCENKVVVDVMMPFVYRMECPKHPGEFHIDMYSDVQFPDVEKRNQAMDHCLFGCLDAVFYQSYAKLYYMKNVSNMRFNDQVVDISRSAMIAVTYAENELGILTNLADTNAFLGMSTVLFASTHHSAINPAAAPYLNVLQNYLQDIQNIKNQNNFVEHLFTSGIISITCDSEDVYRQMMEWAKKRHIIIDKTVHPEGWSDVCRFLYIHHGVMSSKHRMPDDIDAVKDAAILLGK